MRIKKLAAVAAMTAALMGTGTLAHAITVTADIEEETDFVACETDKLYRFLGGSDEGPCGGAGLDLPLPGGGGLPGDGLRPVRLVNRVAERVAGALDEVVNIPSGVVVNAQVLLGVQVEAGVGLGLF